MAIKELAVFVTDDGVFHTTRQKAEAHEASKALTQTIATFLYDCTSLGGSDSQEVAEAIVGHFNVSPKE